MKATARPVLPSWGDFNGTEALVGASQHNTKVHWDLCVKDVCQYQTVFKMLYNFKHSAWLIRNTLMELSTPTCLIGV